MKMTTKDEFIANPPEGKYGPLYTVVVVLLECVGRVFVSDEARESIEFAEYMQDIRIPSVTDIVLYMGEIDGKDDEILWRNGEWLYEGRR